MYNSIAGGLLALVPALAVSAQSSSMMVLCDETKNVVTVLTRDYNEKILWSAREDDGVVVTVWTNETTKTFSVTKTSRDGAKTCLISVGQLLPKI